MCKLVNIFLCFYSLKIRSLFYFAIVICAIFLINVSHTVSQVFVCFARKRNCNEILHSLSNIIKTNNKQTIEPGEIRFARKFVCFTSHNGLSRGIEKCRVSIEKLLFQFQKTKTRSDLSRGRLAAFLNKQHLVSILRYSTIYL